MRAHHKKRLERDDIEQIIDEYKRGLPIYQIARQRCLDQETVRRVLKARNRIAHEVLAGKSILVDAFRMTDEAMRECERMASEGQSVNSIAKAMHVAHATAKRAIETIRKERGEESPLGLSLKLSEPPAETPRRRETIFSWARKWEAAIDGSEK